MSNIITSSSLSLSVCILDASSVTNISAFGLSDGTTAVAGKLTFGGSSGVSCGLTESVNGINRII